MTPSSPTMTHKQLPSNSFHLTFTHIPVAMVLLWLLCCYVNRFIIQRSQTFYASWTAHFRNLMDFIATIDVIFSTTFFVYYFANLASELSHSNGSESSPAENFSCYELKRGIGKWMFNVLFTAGLVALVRHYLLGMMEPQPGMAARCSSQCSQQGSHPRPSSLRTLCCTVSTWRNSWALALLFLLLTSPLIATSAVLDRLPQVGSPVQICVLSAPVWTIVLPMTICLTLVCSLLVSGWSIHLTQYLKRVTSFRCSHGNHPGDNNNTGFRGNNKVNITNNVNIDPGTENKAEEFSLFHQIFALLIILLGFTLFVIVCLYGNMYSEVIIVLRVQLAILMTSLFQLIVFVSGRDAASSRTLSISSGDVISP